MPRHRFVEPALADEAYDDRPLPIGFGQTISQPYMVARATELAAPQPTDRALEVGAGCGYQAAVLARARGEVFAIEIVPELADAGARRRWPTLGYRNVIVESFDGSGGWPEHAPVRRHHRLGGRAAHPAAAGRRAGRRRAAGDPGGPARGAELAVVRREGDHYDTSYDTRCRYVDLLGRFGVGGGAAGGLSARRGASGARPSLRWRLLRRAGLPRRSRGAACTRRRPPGALVRGRARARRWSASPRRAGVPAEDILEINGLADAADGRRPGRLIFVLAVAGQPPPATPRRDGAGAVAGRARRRRARRCAGRSRPAAIVVGSPFGTREGRPHEGIDLPAPVGTPVFAAADGRVVYAGNGIRGYGNLIVLQHAGDLLTVYAHNSVLLVAQGQPVRARRSHRAGRPERARDRAPLALRGARRADSPRPDELPAPTRRRTVVSAAPIATRAARCCARASATSPTSPSPGSCSAT